MGHLLGSGGFGAVYFATDERLHRPVAIKVCSAHRLAADEAQEAALLFEREALTLARLRHPGLTAIWDYFNIDDDWFLVMEYVPGETLRDRLRRTAAPLPLSEALHYASQICQVLQYLHTQHPPIVFRDLKPANIMLTPDGRVKLIDFGIARLFSPGKAKDTVQFGTPGYAPPEQYGGQTEPRSDVYSLGVVLHQMVTGYNPSSSPFRLPPAGALNGAVSESLERVIADATEYKIERRITSAAQFCSMLEVARAAPTMTHQLPQTGMVAHRSTEEASRTVHRTQAWPHAPRTLPQRPAGDGFGHGVLVSVLVVLTLSTLGIAGYFIHNGVPNLDGFFGFAAAPSASAPRGESSAAPGTNVQLPSRLVFTARTSDGGRNLFTASVRQTSERDGVPKLAVENVKQRTHFVQSVEVAFPAISPDGEQIAYTKVSTDNDGTPRSQIWLMSVAGNDDGKRVLGEDYFALAPAWHPDGNQLALEVAAKDNPEQHNIVRLDLNTGDVRPVVDTGGGPTWSLDGKEIAYHSRVGDGSCLQLFTINVDTKDTHPITSLARYKCDPNSGDQWAAWGAKGILAWTRRNLAEPDRNEAPTDRVVILDRTKPEQNNITVFRNESEGKAIPFDNGRWSHNGQYLLFEEQRGNGYGLGFLDPTTPDSQGKYPLSTLNIKQPLTQQDFADWW